MHLCIYTEDEWQESMEGQLRILKGLLQSTSALLPAHSEFCRSPMLQKVTVTAEDPTHVGRGKELPDPTLYESHCA